MASESQSAIKHPVGAKAPSAQWLATRERGALWLIRITAAIGMLLGRRSMRPLARLIALHYACFDRDARRASAQWLRVVHQRNPRFADIYKHIFCFTQVTFDRLFLLAGKDRGIQFARHGNEHLMALSQAKRGAMLLGAHLGSFEALRASGKEEQFPVYIVGHFQNARMINAVVSKLNPEMRGRVIHVGDSPIDLALTLKKRIEEGSMLALLADRVGLNDKSVMVDFFGKKAAFPTGPFLLAAMLKCPILLVFGLFHQPNRYELYCEPFVDRVHLPRKTRDQDLKNLVQAYADRLQEYCRKAPENWFNFFDVWEEQG